MSVGGSPALRPGSLAIWRDGANIAALVRVVTVDGKYRLTVEAVLGIRWPRGSQGLRPGYEWVCSPEALGAPSPFALYLEA